MTAVIDYNELYFSPDTKRLRAICYFLIGLSTLLLLLFCYFSVNAGFIAINFDSLSFLGMHLVDILFSYKVLGFIADARLNKMPSVKKQLSYLLLLYLSVFSLILHLFFAYVLYTTLGWLYSTIAMFNLGKALVPLLIAVIIAANILLVFLLQLSVSGMLKRCVIQPILPHSR